MATKLRDHYDWIVIGDDPGALMSAGLAAKLGLSVLVLPLEAPLIPRVQDKINVLDFESNFLLGLGSSGLWMKCLEAVGVEARDRDKIIGRASEAQILTPAYRLSLHGDRAKLFDEMARELGEPVAHEVGLRQALELADEEISKFWLNHPDRLTFKINNQEAANSKRFSVSKKTSDDPAQSLTLKKLPDYLLKYPLKRHKEVHRWISPKNTLGDLLAKQDPQSEAIRGLFDGVSASLTGSTQAASEDDRSFDFLHLLSLAKQGASYVGGMSAFRTMLLKLAEKAGADVSMSTVCQQIFIQNGRFIGVLPLGHGNMIGGGGAILGAPLARAKKAMNLSGSGGLFKRLKAASQPVGWKMTISLSMHVEALPPGISRRMLWQELNSPPLEIEWVSPGEYQQDKSDQALLFVRTVMPYSSESLSFKEQRILAGRALKKAGQLCPFLEFHLRSVFPDFGPGFNNDGGGEISEKEFKSFYSFSAVEDIPSPLLCFAGKGLGAQSGLEGLFLASKESYPELGSLGPLAAAIEGTAWIAHRSGLAGPIHIRPEFKNS